MVENIRGSGKERVVQVAASERVMEIASGLQHLLGSARELSVSAEKYQLKHVKPRHREIARRLVLGQSQSDIAIDLGLSNSRLSIVCASPLFKQELMKLERERDQSVVDVREQIREIAPVALEQLERTMYNTKSDKIRAEIAMDLLDRAGHGAVAKSVQVQVPVGTDLGNLQDSELKALIMQRVHRMNGKEQERAEMEAAASAYDVEFEKVDSNNDPYKDKI